MMVKKDKKLLLRFLKELGLFYEYIHLVRINSAYHKRSSVKEFLDKVKGSNLIILAFRWSSTKQGYHFWLKVSMCWEKYDGGLISQEVLDRLKILDKSKKL